MAFIPEADQAFLREKFAEELDQPVSLKFFTKRSPTIYIPGQPEIDTVYLRQAEDLMAEVAALSDKIDLQVVDQLTDPATAEAQGIDKVPAVLLQAGGPALRFFGVPAGYEFSTFIQDIFDVSTSNVELSDETKEYLQNLDTDVHIQVFVTPSCPYCPQSARLAHQMMLANPARVKADVIEANEFPEYSERYQVWAVPKTVINDTIQFEGALPEAQVLEFVRQAAAGGQ